MTPRPWHYAVACAASIVFLMLTAVVAYVMLLVVAAATSNGLGGPLALPFLVALAFAAGVVLNALVYAPLSFVAIRATKSRTALRWIVPFVFTGVLVLAGCVVAPQYAVSDPTETLWSRGMIAAGFPLWLGAAFATHWATLFASAWVGARTERWFRR